MPGLAISKDGRLLAAGCDCGTAIQLSGTGTAVWDLQTGTQVAEFLPAKNVYTGDFSPDGKRL